MKTQEVRGKMVAKAIEAKEMALKMGMNPSTFYRKMKNGGKDFTVDNLQIMKEMLDLTDEEAINILILS